MTRAWFPCVIWAVALGCSHNGDGSSSEYDTGWYGSPPDPEPCVSAAVCDETSIGPVKVSWARRFASDEGVASVAGLGVDPQGALTVVGDFSDTVDLGQGPLKEQGDGNVFLARFDSDANVQWAKSFTVSADSVIGTWDGVGVGPGGEVFIQGTIDGQAAFGATTLSGDGAAFAARFDAAGALTWAKAFGPDTAITYHRVFFDSAGRATLVADTYGVDFGGGFMSGGVLVVRFDAEGGYEWSTQLDGSSMLSAPDGEGGIVLLVRGEHGADIAGCGPSDGVWALVRILEDGTCDWQKALPSLSPSDLSVRGGFIALTGWCGGAVTIGDDAAPDCVELVASLDIHGALRWFYAIPDLCVGASTVAVDEEGGAAVGIAGAEVPACVDLGDGHLLTGDSFLVRLDSLGQWVWGLGFEGGSETMYGAHIAFDAQGATILASTSFSETLDLGSGPIPGAAEELAGAFIARFTP